MWIKYSCKEDRRWWGDFSIKMDKNRNRQLVECKPLKSIRLQYDIKILVNEIGMKMK